MSALTDLLVARTGLDDAEVSHLQRLVGEWQLLADLTVPSFERPLQAR